MLFFLYQLIYWYISYTDFSSLPLKNLLINRVNQEIKQGQFKKASISLSEVFQLDSSAEITQINLGLLYKLNRKNKEAQRLLLNATKSENNLVSTSANLHLANLYCLTGDSTKAIEQLEKVLTQDFNNKQARYNLEILKLKFRNYSKEKALQNKPSPNLISPQSIPNLNNDLLSSLKKINLTEQQAKQIFDALGKTEKGVLKFNDKKKNLQNGEFSSW